MAFRDLRVIAGPLVLPINGHEYTLPTVNAEDGARILSALGGSPDDQLTDAELNRILLGDQEAAMVADHVKPDEIARVVWTALADLQSGRAVAEIIWENGVDPKVLNRAQRRAKTSGAAGSTKRPDSTNGTTPPKK